MIPLSSMLLPTAVTVQRKSYPPSAMGGGQRTDSGLPTAYSANVQVSPRNAMRRSGEQNGQVLATRYFDVLTTTDPSVQVDDMISWAGRTLSVLAPAADVSLGSGTVWLTETIEVTG